MRINVKNLRAFYSVVRYGGFSKAAAELHVSQPSLTRQVQNLEEAYGLKLLERSTRHISLTPIGQVLYNRLVDLFSDMKGIDVLLSAETGNEVTTYSVSHPYLVQFINAGQLALPKAKMNIEIMPSADVYRGLIEYRCDFGFLTLPDEYCDLETIELGSFPIIAIISETNPLFARETLSLNDLCEQTVIIGPSEASTRWNFDRVTKKYGVRPKKVEVTDVLGTCIYKARAGLGIGIVGGDGVIERSDQSARRFREPEMFQKLHFACRPAKRRSRMADQLALIAQTIFMA